MKQKATRIKAQAEGQEREQSTFNADALWLAAMVAVLCGLLILALQA